MYGKVYSTSINTMNETYLFGNTVTYSDGKYTLKDTITSNDWSSIRNDSSGLLTHRYTCLDENSTCSSINYIYYTDDNESYSITLTGGKKVEDALSDMLDNNENDSAIKTYIDNWYSTNMTNYTSKLEDAIWCSDRNISLFKGGWDPDLDNAFAFAFSPNLLFDGAIRFGMIDSPEPDLACNRDIDKFTLNKSNGNGNLTYPIGLLTVDEMMFAGSIGSANNTHYLYSNSDYWGITPGGLNGMFAANFYIESDGSLYGNSVNTSENVRPSVSLSSGTEISSGNGTANSPYIVD